MPCARRHSRLRRSGLNWSRSTPRAPDRNVVVHPLGAQDRGRGFGRHDDRVAAPIEAAHDRAGDRLQPLQIVILKIGVEARVDRGDDRNALLPRPADRAVGDDVRAGDMDDIGVNSARSRRTLAGSAEAAADIPAAPGCRGRHADQVAGRREGRALDRRRIDADTARPGAAGSRPAGSAPGWRRRAHNYNCPRTGRCGALRASLRPP